MTEMYRAFGKRTLDIILSATALVVLSPLLLVAAILVRVGDGGPALFRQSRVGAGGRHFTVLKFRSMRVNAPNVPSAAGATIPVTRIGQVLRRTNIDELPQLLNILRGDMSIVGPRPPIPAQAALVEMRRANGALAVRPGLTGLAQVESFDGMTDAEKAELDGRYAATISLGGDLKLIFRTFGYLAHRPPVY